MNFELIDNLVQVAALGGAALVALWQTLRHGDRRSLILAFAYACFAMGTLFWVLHIAIIGDIPRVFYVSEVSWIASYFFFFSLQLVRTEGRARRLSLLPALCALAVVVVVVPRRMMGPSYFVSALFAFALGGIVYLSVLRLRTGARPRAADVCMLACAVLQLGVYLTSWFMTDYARFNLYFAVDLLLTGHLVALLPLTWREVTAR